MGDLIRPDSFCGTGMMKDPHTLDDKRCPVNETVISDCLHSMAASGKTVQGTVKAFGKSAELLTAPSTSKLLGRALYYKTYKQPKRVL